MTLNPDLRARFLAGMSNIAATVNVVTTDGPAGRAGATVSAMSSVSADTPKPTLLVCVHRESNSATAILENGVFCVNVLREDQSYLADIFAGRFSDEVEDKFGYTPWQPAVTGSPRVVDPLVAFDCRTVSSDLVGTHHVFFGEVEDVFIAGHGTPLIYSNRSYGAAARIDTPGSLSARRGESDRRLRLACFYTISAFVLPGLFRDLNAVAPDLDVSLIEGDQARLHAALGAGEADLALMYDETLLPHVEAEVLVEREPYILLAEDHPLAGLDVIRPGDLAGQDMVLLSTPPSPEYFLGVLEDAGVTPRVAWRSGALETVRGLVAQGLGYSLLASRPATDLSYDGKRLVTRPLAWRAKPARVMLARREGARLSPAAEIFADCCRRHFGGSS